MNSGFYDLSDEKDHAGATYPGFARQREPDPVSILMQLVSLEQLVDRPPYFLPATADALCDLTLG
jgi:hypothetical protein